MAPREPDRTPLLAWISAATGWLADRRIPGLLRPFVFRTYSRLTGAVPGEAQLPLSAYPSLSTFFVRRLRPGLRSFSGDPGVLSSPVDGTVQAVDPIGAGSLVQAKGRSYPVAELLAGVGPDLDLEGGTGITIYLSPRDYHRIHAPEAGALREVVWVEGSRYPVRPRTLSARERVLSINERVVLRFETDRGPVLLVLVGALNVGRIRVVGVPPGASGPLEPPRPVERGEEIGRFEMGSTIVLVLPRGALAPRPEWTPETPVRLGDVLGDWTAPGGTADRPT